MPSRAAGVESDGRIAQPQCLELARRSPKSACVMRWLGFLGTWHRLSPLDARMKVGQDLRSWMQKPLLAQCFYTSTAPGPAFSCYSSVMRLSKAARKVLSDLGRIGGKKGGSKGGRARWAPLTAEQRSAIARRAARARWARVRSQAKIKESNR